MALTGHGPCLGAVLSFITFFKTKIKIICDKWNLIDTVSFIIEEAQISRHCRAKVKTKFLSSKKTRAYCGLNSARSPGCQGK
jgi:hypothetical protein